MKLAGCLCPEDIASAIERAAAELEREGVPPETRLRFRLSLEEVLLFYRETFGETTPFSLNCRMSSSVNPITSSSMNHVV